MKATVLILSLVSAASGHVAEAAIHRATEPVSKCYRFDSEIATVQGTMFTRIYFGPPNYGENSATDRREEQALLLLDSPICVRDDPVTSSQSENNVIVMQLAAISVKPKTVYDAVGHRVEVSGSFFHAETGHHRTPELIDVHGVRVID